MEMKKNILYILASLLLFASCLSDDSSEGDLANFQDVTIEGIESKYLVTSFTGNHLQISPTIDTDIASDKLTYKWSIVKDEEIDATTQSEIPFEVIGTERNLDYEVELAPGSYVLKFEVTAENGYTATSKATVNATTAFLNAYYLMKETADGNTDLDYYTADGVMRENVLSEAALNGSPLKGKPRYLSVGYNSCYYDDNADQQVSTLIYTSTEDGDFCGVRSTDFGIQFDKSNICYQALDDDEKPYGVCLNVWTEILLTSKGTHWAQSGDMSSGTGKFGTIDLKTGMSRHIVLGLSQAPYYDMFLYYWDEDNGSFYYVDYNGGISPLYDENYEPLDYSDYVCVGSGVNSINGTAMFALQNKTTGERKIFSVSTYGVSEVCTLSSDFVTATCDNITFNVDQGTIAYGTDGKDVYALDYMTGVERKLTVSGLPTGTITYISNVYYSGSAASVDYLCIGTEANGKYTASFYKTVGGAPDGSPVFQMQGTGKISGVLYVTPTCDFFVDAKTAADCIGR